MKLIKTVKLKKKTKTVSYRGSCLKSIVLKQSLQADVKNA